MSEIVPFDFHGNQVRVVMINGEPWWVVNDVCGVLGIADSRQAAERVDKADRCQIPISFDHDQRRNVWACNESGLYDLIFRSDKPAAREFRRWVTGVVLPQIRRTGSYVETPQTYAAALRAAADAWEESERQRHVAVEAKAYADQLEPRAEEYDAYIDSEGTHTLAEVAQLMHYTSGAPMGRQRFIDRLRDLEVLCQPSSSEGPRPRQEYVEKGWFELHPTYFHKGRRRIPYMQTHVTPVGVTNIWRTLVSAGEDLMELP